MGEGEPLGERIARLEVQVYDLKVGQDRVEHKVDTLLTAFNIGQGKAVAWAKVGGLILLFITSIAWIYQNIIEPLFITRGH